MDAALLVGNKRIELTEDEWNLLRKYIIRDTINFWETTSREIDGGLIPPELAPDHEMINRMVLYSLKSKLSEFFDD